MQKIIFTVMALSLWLQATPQALNNMELITNMEKFTPVCKYYIGVIRNQKIKSLCRQYDKKLNNILRLGNRVDKYIVPTTHTHMYLGKEHNCTNQTLKLTKYDSKVLNRYRSDVFSLNKFREEIVEYVSSEKARARRQYDVEYHEKLIRKYVIDVYSEDIIFMGEHKEIYSEAQNSRYLDAVRNKRPELLTPKQRKYLATMEQKEKWEKEIEYHNWREKCGYRMTPYRHNNRKSGTLSGQVVGSDVDGYFVKSSYGEIYYIEGGPLYTGGYVKKVPVISRGENMRTIAQVSKVKGAAHKVYYYESCLKN